MPCSQDPVLFIYPAYIFKGGGFITFNKDVPKLTTDNIYDSSTVNSFFNNKIGAQKNSVYEMMLFSLAKRNNINTKDLTIYDTPLNDGLLASQNGSVDIASAGLTQITEALKNKGRVVLTMDDLGFADITGFICKKSTLEKREKEVKALLKMWFDCVDFVMQDIENNSKWSLEYLNQKAATQYTFEQYKTALSQEYFPISIKEAQNVIISNKGLFSYERISEEIISYLVDNEIISKNPPLPKFINVE